MTLAPIAVFVYKRPDHAQRTLDALAKCDGFADSPLYVYCDGPRSDADADAVREARAVVRTLVGGHATIVEAPANKGLAASIIHGVTELCARHGRVIVLEDDLIVAPTFIRYMNAALDHYELADRVMQISAHMFPVAEFSSRAESMLLPFTTSWGWGTWQRAWQYFDASASGWRELGEDRAARRRFNVGDAYDYYSMLVGQVRGKNDSWAIRWYLSVFRRNGLTLFPPRSLVENIGFDGSGTHGGHSGRRALHDAAPKSVEFTPARSDDVVPEELDLTRRALARLQGGPLRLLKRVRRWARRTF